jgi:hypothetical protein
MFLSISKKQGDLTFEITLVYLILSKSKFNKTSHQVSRLHTRSLILVLVTLRFECIQYTP